MKSAAKGGERRQARKRAAGEPAARVHGGRDHAAHPPGPVAKNADDLTLPCLIHDLNNVFQVLLGAADVLSEDPQWQGISGAILRSIERGREITASLEAAGQPPAELATVAAKAIALAKDSLLAGRTPEVCFVNDVEAGLILPQAWAWERVLINLLLNALHAMPQGGTVTVSGRTMGGIVEISVVDEGSGIAAELLPVIFEPHVSTRSTSGLGLHIVHTIVTQQRGQVRAANRPEGGAAFTITIPAASIPSAPGNERPLTRSARA